MSFTYTTLKETLQNYTQNTETTFLNSMDMFIRLAEERILKSTQLNVFQKNVTGALSTGNAYLAVPSDFLSPHSLSITNSSSYEYLQFKDIGGLNALSKDENNRHTYMMNFFTWRCSIE